MFGLVNVIVELQITQANHIEEMHDTIVPDVVKAQIEKRDAPKQIEKKKRVMKSLFDFETILSLGRAAGNTFGGPFHGKGELYQSSKSASSPLGAIVVARCRNCGA
jgi:hypothetical protein